MDVLDRVINTFHNAQQALDDGQYTQAFELFDNALHYYRASDCQEPWHDLLLWSDLLLGKADGLIRVGLYGEATQHITRALKDCPQSCYNPAKAKKWLSHATGNDYFHPAVPLTCYEAALHFALGDYPSQSCIHGQRAALYCRLGEAAACDRDIEKCRMYDLQTAWDQGRLSNGRGIELFNANDYKNSVINLQLAEKFLAPSDTNSHLKLPMKKDLHHCCSYLVSAAWNAKQYTKALEAGKKCYALTPIKDKNEAIRWKTMGNGILKSCEYHYAVQCYSLAIQYTAPDDNQLLGILHSNRSSAYFKSKQFVKAKEDAEKCLEYCPQWSKSYHRLGSALHKLQRDDEALEVLRRGLDLQLTREEKYDIFLKIMDVVSSCEDGPMKIKYHLPHECIQDYLKERVVKNDWRTVELLLLGGGGPHSHHKGEGGIATGCHVSVMSLGDLIGSKTQVIDKQKLLVALIDHGAPVNGGAGLPLLAAAVNEKDYESAVILLKNKADVNGILQTKVARSDDTPTHAAFRIGLLYGIWDIFILLMENHKQTLSDDSDAIPEPTDCKGNGLFHLIASQEFPHFIRGINLLREYKMNPNTKNKNGQTPLMMFRGQKGERYRLIEEHSKSIASCSSKRKKKRKKNKKGKELNTNQSREEDSPSASESASSVPLSLIKLEKDIVRNSEGASNVRPESELEILRKKIIIAIKNLEVEVGLKDHDSGRNEEEPRDSPVNVPSSRKQEDLDNSETTVDLGKTFPVDVEDKVPLPAKNLSADDLVEEDDSEEDCDLTFDNLTWEVECTSEVWKFLNDKRLPPDLRKRIVSIIRRLAEGDMRGDLAKRLEGLPKQNDILLFEAKLGKGARILWERAIAFSPRSSNNPELLSEEKKEGDGRIYSDIIRVWDIALDHDTVPRKIEKIVRSHKRGSSCILKKDLRGYAVEPSTLSSNKGQLSIPNIYSHKDDLAPRKDSEYFQPGVKSQNSNEVSTTFFPPGSPEETEFHILKFYAFSNSLVNAVLDEDRATNVDFPFRVSELEHAVINLKPKSSILLLGRSGTGKTTCCLYRLWCNFQRYWEGRSLDEPSFPKIVQFVPAEIDGVAHANGDSGENHKDRDCEETRQAESDQVGGNSSRRCSTAIAANSVTVGSQDCVASCSQTTCDEELENVEDGPAYEHLHQAFITKNAVLCTEVQKSFNDLSRACSSTRSHCEYQRFSPVNRLDNVEEQAWPLFVCSRDWLLTLDASLPDQPFFPRNDEGKLLRPVKGWAEEDNHLRLIPEEDSENDDYDEEGAKADPRNEEAHSDPQEVRGVDPRLEVTYQVFKNEIWPKMTKRKKVDYHPTLVWTEIRSYIKGSVEALHSQDGYISLEEYQTLGRKRAPSFSADREIIYELFLAYQRVKRSNGMFDEADLVYHIYHRLQGHVPDWSIHEMYVDETQDFTQAELTVIIHCCRDPNRLFFTGDTAQSIMRGIAFRFEDLKSLFYYMNASFKAVGHQAHVNVPDRVYQLTHNYRSHAGILNLASSVTDLLLHFFPESFDRMERDQGLFEGPKPVLLESCSFSDLAVILRGHKRKTSPIEFGAHQVVLVASDDVRDSLPDELSMALVMTIYEAKGLEFDDVLVYNFFKESQARKEWRVVGNYNVRDAMSAVNETGIAEILEDNLQTKTRPLEFDSDRHKILISEFKYLYTALTRARVNVWLFDEDEDARTPMFEYIKKRGVVKLKTVDEASLEGMFAETSSKEEWSNQGHFFYRKGLWKVSLQCFTRSEDEGMAMMCRAQLQAENVLSVADDPAKRRNEFAQAALLFLQCGMSNEADLCLRNARERLLLAKLYQKQGKVLKAAQLLRRERKFSEASEDFEKGLDFMRAVDCLLEIEKYNKALQVISRYKMLVRDETDETVLKQIRGPRDNQRDESICYQAAEYYLRRGQHTLMTESLNQLSVNDRLTFLKLHGCVEEAAELMLREGRAREAAEMMRSNGKFLKAASFTDDYKFAAECYLVTARSVISEEKNRKKDAETSDESRELTEGPLQRAAELFQKCQDLNGQAEVKRIRGEWYNDVSYFHKAENLYNKAFNYTGMAECIDFLIKKENYRIFPRKKASNTLFRLLSLILALHKKSLNTNDRKAIAMCETHFGLVDTLDPQTKRIPRHEMVRFSHIQNEEDMQDEEINVEEAHKVIESYLFEKAVSFIKRVWDSQRQTNEQYTRCSRHFSGIICEKEGCRFYHNELSREHFDDCFYALCVLIHFDKIVAEFSENLRKEAPQVAYRLRDRLLADAMKFRACHWLEELLFPARGQLGSSYVLREKHISCIRAECRLRSRITEFAKWHWSRAKQDDRWLSSDLFIRVSNLLHLASAPLREIYYLLSKEERAFDEAFSRKKCRFYAGFLEDDRRPGRFELFTRLLERSRHIFRRNRDIIGASQFAVKRFLSLPARRRKIPYPSIAHAVMILEYNFTLCLLLYSRLTKSYICLPESYLSIIKFWDIVYKFGQNQITTYEIIQYHLPQFPNPRIVQEMTRRVCEQLRYMVALMFGSVSLNYNIILDAFSKECINTGETERVLILALVMLCNCGVGVLDNHVYFNEQELPCEIVIRRQLLKLRLPSALPDRVNQCIGAVKASSGFADVAKALEELLAQDPRKEKLFDVTWDEMKMRDYHRNCQLQFYPHMFRFEVPVEVEDPRLDANQQESEPAEEDFDGDVQDSFAESYEAGNQIVDDFDHKKEGKKNACVIIQNAFRAWREKKRHEELAKDPVEYRFRHVKLDMFNCTICDVSFEDNDAEGDTLENPTSSADPIVTRAPHDAGSSVSERITSQLHSSRNDHLAKVGHFKLFKEFYRKSVHPVLLKAEALQDEFKLSKNTCYKLDLDKLKVAVDKLKAEVRNVEKCCSWDQLHPVRKASGEMAKQSEVVEKFKENKATVPFSGRNSKVEYTARHVGDQREQHNKSWLDDDDDGGGGYDDLQAETERQLNRRSRVRKYKRKMVKS